MVKKISIVVITLALMSSSLWVFWQLEQQHSKPFKPAAIIPDNVQAIISCHNVPWHKFEQTTRLLGDLTDPTLPQFKSILLKADSLRRANLFVTQLISEEALYLSIHKTGLQRSDWALSCSPVPATRANIMTELSKLLKSDYVTRDFDGCRIHEFSGSVPIAVIDHNDFVAICSSSLLAEEFARHQTVDANSPVTQLKHVLDAQPSGTIGIFLKPDSSVWHSLELDDLGGALLFHGVRLQSSATQVAFNHRAYPVLPHSFSELTIRPFDSQKVQEQFAGALSDIETACECDALALFAHNTEYVAQFSRGDDHFLCFDREGLLDEFESIIPLVGNDIQEYKGYPLMPMVYPQLAGALALSSEEFTHFTFEDGHIILAVTPTALKAYIDDISASSDEIPWYEPARFLSSDPVSEDWKSQNVDYWPFIFHSSLERVYAGSDSSSYVSLAVAHSAQNTQTTISSEAIGWQLTLEKPAISGPWLVKNHYTNEGEILVQTSDFKLHHIGSSGKELWTINIGEPIVGDVQQIDIFRNDKLQMIFNTSSKIYCLDRLGRHVDGFPVTLSGNATSPLAVLDYDSNKKYRLLIGLSNGNIVNYTVDGKQTSGWSFEDAGKSPVEYIEHIRIRNNDYVFALTKEGAINLLKRNGRSRYKSVAKAPNHKARDINFVGGSSIGDTRMYYPDTAGNIVVVQFDKAALDFGLTGFSQGSSLTMADLNNDGKSDFVVADGDQLRAYDASFTRLFKVSLASSIADKPKVFEFTKVDRRIGVVAGDQLHLFDTGGNEVSGFPLAGNRGFIIYDLNRDGKFECIRLSGNQLLATSL